MASKRESLIASAEKALQKGKPEAALKDYLKVLEETPNDINILNKVGDLFVRLNRNEESIPYFTKIAEHYSKDGFFLKAIAIYKKINKLDPARLDVYERLAELYGKQGLGMEAKSQYQVLADYYTKQDNVSGAISIYQKMLAAEPTNIQLHVKLADLYTQARRVPDALKEYAVVAGMLKDRGALDESIQVYEKALKIAPDNVEILRSFVPLLVDAGRLDEARAFLKKALETTPRSVPLFLLAAEAALNANDMADARNFAAKAQAVEPENEEVLAIVVKIQLRARRPDLAFAAAAPLADQAVRRGEAKKALGILTPIAKAAPDNEDVLRKIVEVASSSGDEVAAVPYRSALAEIWRKVGKISEAIEQLRICTRLAPDVAEFRARLTQLEPQLPAAPAAPPPPSLSFPGAPPARPAPVAEPATSAAPAARVVPSGPDEFEFELPDDELVEAAPAAPIMAPPPGLRPPPTFGPPPEAKRQKTDPALRMPPAPLPTSIPAPPALGGGGGDDWMAFDRPVISAADAIAAFEARQSAATPDEPAVEEAEEIVELPVSAEIPLASAIEAIEVEEPIEDAVELAEAADAVEREEVPESRTPVEAPAAPRSAARAPVPILSAAIPLAPAVDTHLEEALVEAEVFRKYGLLDKAVEHLRAALRKSPNAVKLREKLFEILLEKGDKAAARTEAAPLLERYRADGREDRVRGLEALLGEPAAPPAAVLAAPPVLAALPPAPSPAGLIEAHVEPVSPAEPPVEPQVVAPSAQPGASAPPSPKAEPEPEPEPEPESMVPLEVDLGGGAPPEVATGGPGSQSPVAATPAHQAAARGARPAVPKPRAPLSISQILQPPAHVAPKAKPVAAREIEIPLPAKSPAKPRPPAPSAPTDISLPADLLAPRPTLATPKAPAAKARDFGLPDLGAPVRPKPAHTPPPVVPIPAAAVAPAAPPVAPPEPEAPAAVVEPEEAVVPLEFTVPVGVEPEPVPEAPPPPVIPPPPGAPTEADLSEIDFCLDQGMVVDAAERLASLEARFPGHLEIATRRSRLEGARSPSEEQRPALHDILSEDLESVLDAELGRALTDQMAKGPGAPVPASVDPTRPAEGQGLDESGLFSDEQEFFNFADELRTEMKQEVVASAPEGGGEVSLEEIFREFKKGVEQQLSPEDYETHYNLGIAYKEMGLTDEAIGEFQLASKDPLHAVECCSMLGLCFLEKGLPQLAIKWYRKGLETLGIHDDDRLGLLYDLGKVYVDVGDRDSAYKAFLDIYGSDASYRDVGEWLKQLKAAEPV